jgi:hypothetical protein
MGWQNADVAMHFQLNQAFLGEYLESASLDCATIAANRAPA